MILDIIKNEREVFFDKHNFFKNVGQAFHEVEVIIHTPNGPFGMKMKMSEIVQKLDGDKYSLTGVFKSEDSE